MTIDALMDRAADLKGRLVDYASTPGFARRLSQSMDRLSESVSESFDLWSETVEMMLYEPGPDGREPLLHRYLRTNKNIDDADREVYEAWRDRNVYGLFRVTNRDGPGATLQNLLDEMDYRAFATIGADAMAVAETNRYVLTRLVPIGDVWVISGNMQLFGVDDVATVCALAASLLKLDPTLPYRNPEKVERGRDVVARHHEVFLSRFGSTVVRENGAGAIADYRAFLDDCTRATTAERPSAAEHARAGEELVPDASFP